MKLAVLFSGGKDSCYATYLAKKNYKISCLISIISTNKESYMFHTSNIKLVKKQAQLMNIPIIIKKTQGKKELELNDLEQAIKQAIKKYKIQGIVTGAVESIYQSSRIQKICNKFKIECFNPLWQKNQIELIEELIKNKLEIIITQISAEGFNESWLGKKIDKKALDKLIELNKKYGISICGEGGEFETLVLDSTLFNKKIKLIKTKKIIENANSGI